MDNRLKAVKERKEKIKRGEIPVEQNKSPCVNGHKFEDSNLPYTCPICGVSLGPWP